MGIYIVAKFGTDWLIYADARVITVKYGKFSNSRADNLDSSGPITFIIEFIWNLMVIYILTKFGADWLIFVDARVLTRKLWTDVRQTDGQKRTVSDHNSTPCSGELKKAYKRIYSIL